MRFGAPLLVSLLSLGLVAAPVGYLAAARDAEARDEPPKSAGKEAPPREKTPRKRDPLTQALFRTDVPDHPYDIVLARPTEDSITVSVVSYADVTGFIEFGLPDQPLTRRTPAQNLDAGKSALFRLDGLSAGRAYQYRWRYAAQAPRSAKGVRPAANFEASETFSFQTPRRPNSAFTFTIQADSHLDFQVEPALYLQTLRNAQADAPDFHVDLGDTFMTEKYARFHDAAAQYLAQRYYLGQLCRQAPLFMALGNHDGENGTSGRATDDIGPWSYLQRTTYFPEPIVNDRMYSGSTGIKNGVGSNYYAFEWGDALFVVLDPFWSTTERIRGGGGGDRKRGEIPTRNDDNEPLAPIDASWAATLGRAQYDWLSRTLANSSARFRFVFIHHLVGGLGGTESRGGVEASSFFEWGGLNADGSPGFARHRPDWQMPIHDLLVKHHVSAVFHGHDHLYVHNQRDGLHYQCVPQPATISGGVRSAVRYGYKSGEIQSSPGHVRVRVTDRAAIVEFIRSAIAENPASDRGRNRAPRETNGAVVKSYEIAASPAQTPRR